MSLIYTFFSATPLVFDLEHITLVPAPTCADDWSHACTHIYEYIHIYVYIYIHLYMYIYIYVWIYEMYIESYVSIYCIDTYFSIYIFTSTCTYVDIRQNQMLTQYL